MKALHRAPAAAAAPARLAQPRSSRVAVPRVRVPAATATDAAAADPAAAHPAAWAACLDALAPLALPADDAADALAQAFGWSRSTYWRGSRDKAQPDPAAVAAAVAVLTAGDGLGMDAAAAGAVVTSFPECLALDGDGTAVRAAVAKLAADWKMVGGTAARAIVRTPRVLGYTVDCAGDCVGECDRCWVRF